MNLFTEIKDLFFSIENEKKQHSEKMEKLQELINKSHKEVYSNGWKQGVLDSKEEIQKLFEKKQNY